MMGINNRKHRFCTGPSALMPGCLLASLLPRLPYMTRLDYFSVGSTLLVFMALLVVVATSYLAATNRNRIAKYLDLSARGAFPAAFLLLLGWFMSGQA